MREKALVFVIGALAGAVVAAAIGCINFKRPDVVVREPGRPGESAIAYEPPSHSGLSVEMVADVAPMLNQFMSPKVEEKAPGVYVASGYALGNVAMVLTGDGLVIFDSTDNEDVARAIMGEFRKISDQPVRYLVYSHFHPDHTQGSRVFAEEGTEVVATEAFVEWNHYQNEMLAGHHLRARRTQAGAAEEDWAFPLPLPRNPFGGLGDKHVVVPPTITFEREYSFELGGRRFEFFATSGETEDHLAMWLPEDKILFAGDLYYQSFPNLSTPMLESRPVRGWIASLERFIELEPEYLILGHTESLAGRELIKDRLGDYRDAIKHVHDETVRCINEGKTVGEAVAEIKLPERLANKPFLQEYYGRVSWSVRGIYHDYKGWYDGKGSGLNPLPPEYRARELVLLAGGADKLLGRAIELQEAGEHQLCAELCDVAIEANPDDKLAYRIKAESMRQLAFGLPNLNCFGFYRSAYSVNMKASGAPPNAE